MIAVDYLIMVLGAALILGILIFVHELGHFLLAKWCRVGVLDFSIGFGRTIWRKKIGETTYALRLVPLGGYVRMLGDDPREIEAALHGEKLPTDDLQAHAEPIDPVLLSDRSRWFLNKPIWQKASIVLAGPAFNFIFAYLLAVGVAYAYGRAIDIDKPIIGGTMAHMPAEAAGLKEGDEVRSIDGTALKTWMELSEIVRNSGGKEMVFVVDRRTESASVETLTIKVTGTSDKSEIDLIEQALGSKNPIPYRIGISAPIERVPNTFGEAVIQGAGHVWGIMYLTGKIVGAMFQGVVSPTKVVGGPVAVLSGAAQSTQRGLESALGFMILLSVSLAMFNLLPIPVLDGGHLLFFVIEGLKGSPLNVRWQAIANQVGLALLILLMLFAVSNDFRQLFS